jgi:fructose-1,6-bisphosphatase/inositol monophosphatase family enzyme
MRTLPSRDVDRPNDVPTSSDAEAIDPFNTEVVLAMFGAICDRATTILAANDDWSASGERDGQYSVDVEIDAVCLDMLHGAGFAVLSEESGRTGPIGDDAPTHLVVVDPLDGSTNAALGLPWCATALCLVSNGVPAVAMVANLRTGTRYTAVLGGGAKRDGHPIVVGSVGPLADAIIAVNARPPATFRPAQYRSMGATALDIASVAAVGGFDGSIDFDDDRIGVWDYLAAVTIVREAGGVAGDALGRDLVTLEHGARRRPVTAGSQQLLDELLAAARGD